MTLNALKAELIIKENEVEQIKQKILSQEFKEHLETAVEIEVTVTSDGHYMAVKIAPDDFPLFKETLLKVSLK